MCKQFFYYYNYDFFVVIIKYLLVSPLIIIIIIIIIIKSSSTSMINYHCNYYPHPLSCVDDDIADHDGVVDRGMTISRLTCGVRT